ncbi:hypothetical protein AB0C34_17000 [Nocardia sp. NPDC049220]|uniref:hypothetical protein n=1 Tax=Nocardia sp. NPDC049220 TaxID=3155273 RepID=UPI0033F6C089
MTATAIADHLSFSRAGMAYLNSPSHKTGLKNALTAAEVYALPTNSGSRANAIEAALRAYPEWTYTQHDRSLQAAVIAAAEAWTGASA